MAIRFITRAVYYLRLSSMRMRAFIAGDKVTESRTGGFNTFEMLNSDSMKNCWLIEPSIGRTPPVREIETRKIRIYGKWHGDLLDRSTEI